MEEFNWMDVFGSILLDMMAGRVLDEDGVILPHETKEREMAEK